MTFNGSTIFGSQVTQNGPRRGYRSQDAELPGVDGLRTYRLGKGAKTWNVGGRLTANSMALAVGLVESGIAYVDGRLYTFIDIGGTAYTNCQLTDFHPVGRYEACTVSGVTSVSVRVTATIRQLTP